IDILIYNETSENAILIQNKIYAGDSNNKNEIEGSFPEDYKGQLQRYYNTITRGIDCNMNPIEAKYKKAVKQVVYLTFNRHKASVESCKDVPLDKLNCIDYTTHINDWLLACMQESAD